MPWPTLDRTFMGARMLAGLPRFLRQPPPDVARSRAALQQSLCNRGQAFLDLLRHGVYGHARSPYVLLLRRAGMTLHTCEQLVRDHGVEGTLDRFYDAGVHVTLDEFKGRTPIRRGGVTVDTSAHAFDNPIAARHYEARTGGSRGPGSRFIVDLDVLAHDAHYDVVFFEMFGLTPRPCALWHPAPPGAAGLKWALRLARFNVPFERWFSQTPLSLGHDPQNAAMMQAMSRVSRWAGRPVPMPQHVGVADAVVVARWLADCRARGTPAWMSTTASSAVRACRAAPDHGLDIAGTFFRASGEPLTRAKQQIIADAGCTARCHYAMAEVGRIGVACGRPVDEDDVHLAADKVACLQRDMIVSGDARVPGIALTTLLTSVPKIMVNVEVGDYAVMDGRACGCEWAELGFTRQLRTIRSYDKLTSEGMHFIGADLIALVDEVLPARFGGAATDYQFVEEERDGLSCVSLVVSQNVGDVHEDEVQQAVLHALESRDGVNRMMARLWREGGTLRVLRSEPYTTSAGKILALHVTRGAAR